MAYFRRVKGGWRAEVERAGARRSRTFATKGEAQAWAAQLEVELLRSGGRAGEWPRKTVGDAIERYMTEVTPRKRSARWELMRFGALKRDLPWLWDKLLVDVVAADIAAWRDARLRRVSAATVQREATPLRHVWSVARDEWGWCGESPWRSVWLPRAALARTRQVQPWEVRAIVRALAYVTGEPPRQLRQEVALAWLVAHHTALRAGEVLSLRRSSVDLERRVVRLDRHKTDHVVGARLVPFTRKAARLLRWLDGWAAQAGRDEYFQLSSRTMDMLFRRARDAAGVVDLHFHDSRAAALTRLARRVDVLVLARISGHTDLRQLMSAYYRESAESIAARL